MQKSSSHFQANLRKFLQFSLYGSISLVLCGLLMKLKFVAGGNEILSIALSSLTGIFFIHAYVPNPYPDSMMPDLYANILFKVLYIGSSVLCIGILFSLLHLEGAKQMLIIGVGTTGIATLSAALLLLKNADNWIVLKKAFVSGFLVLMVAVCFFSQVVSKT